MATQVDGRPVIAPLRAKTLLRSPNAEEAVSACGSSSC